MKRVVRSLVLLCAPVLLLNGCASMLKVKVVQPAPVNFGSSKRLTIVHTEGRRSAREFLISNLIAQTRAGGYWQATDRTEEGITLKIAGRNVQAMGAKTPQAPDEIFVRVDVLEWNSGRDTVVRREMRNGTYADHSIPVYKGKVLLGVTAATAKGKALLAEKEYIGEWVVDVDHRSSEQMGVEGAASAAVRQLLSDITPALVDKSIRIDDEDQNQKPFIEYAKAGNLPKAIEGMRAYLATNTTSPSAMYNLAVFLDASGQYQEALDLYSKAASNSTKPFYADMRTECAKRLADQAALSAETL
jgi:tetratricopeptide (TPR) repeat protein